MEAEYPPRFADAAARLGQASRIRYAIMRDQASFYWQNAGVYWQRYKPRTLLQWMGFAGIALLAVSALSTAVNVIGGLALGVAWVGLAVYFITVVTSSVAALFCGPVLMVFSGTCAVVGTCILAGVLGVHAAMAIVSRARTYAMPYLEPTPQRPKQQQLPPTAQVTHSAPTPSPATAEPGALHAMAVDQACTSPISPAQLLGDVSPGRPQMTAHIDTTASASSHNATSDVAFKHSSTSKVAKVANSSSTGIPVGAHTQQLSPASMSSA